MLEISFLIPVYNQSEDLKMCISSIVRYHGNDIEIVVNDDCSTENLGLIVDSFHDERIRWCHNYKNLGLDGNILTGIQNCRGKYVFLLRTRDLMVAESIPDILVMIKENPDIVYLTGTCLDDDGLPRLFYRNQICGKGESALRVHDSIHFHPSGSLFRTEDINIHKYQKYLENFPVPRLWFMVEQLIRLELTQKGDFCLMSRPVWVYTYTNRNEKKSVHPVEGGHLYTQKNTFLRFQSEMEFISNEFEGKLRIQRFIKTFEFWLYHATWGYLAIMSDKNIMLHYGIKPECVDVETERERFLIFTERVENNLGIVEDEYFQEKQVIIKGNVEYEKLKQKQELRRIFVNELSLPIIRQIEKMKLEGNNLADCIVQNGFYRIGIYGIGYLGRFIWDELVHSDKVKVVFISDKMYLEEMAIGHGVHAIPSSKIECYDIDVLLITPIQHKNEIMQEINCKVPQISISDLLQKETI